jgi:hypothetical protein
MQSIEQGWRSGENSLDRNLTTSENALNRGHDLTMQSNDQGWRSGENSLDRALTQSESALGRTFTTSEREAIQAFNAAQDAIGRDFTTAEREAGQVFAATENALGRALTSSEREAIQAFDAAQNQLNRDLTTSENALNRDFDRATQLQAAEIDADARLTQHLYGLEELGYRFNLDQYNVSKTYAANSASALYTSIANILADPNLEPATKNSAINNAIAVFNDQMKFGSTVYGTPLPGWGDTTTQPNNTIPTPPNSTKIQQASSWVQDAYQTSLGRQPDAPGLEYWTQQAVANGWTKEQTAAIIRQAAIENGERLA